MLSSQRAISSVSGSIAPAVRPRAASRTPDEDCSRECHAGGAAAHRALCVGLSLRFAGARTGIMLQRAATRVVKFMLARTRPVMSQPYMVRGVRADFPIRRVGIINSVSPILLLPAVLVLLLTSSSSGAKSSTCA